MFSFHWHTFYKIQTRVFQVRKKSLELNLTVVEMKGPQVFIAYLLYD